jgi:hypothetical protein
MVEQMAALWSRTITKEVLGLSWRSLLGLLGLRDHIASPEGLRSLLKRELPYRTFAETAVPLHVVCAELVTGEAVVLSSGWPRRLSRAPPFPGSVRSPYNYSNGADLIAKARNVTRAWIDDGGLDCGDFPSQLAMHSHA